MEINESIIQLIAELENIIGHQCHNPNSYNGYTGDEGCTFRYPICYTNKNGRERSTKMEILDADESSISSMHYKFGSNHLYIGDALIKILEHIEEKCGININDLLEERNAERKFQTYEGRLEHYLNLQRFGRQ